MLNYLCNAWDEKNVKTMWDKLACDSETLENMAVVLVSPAPPAWSDPRPCEMFLSYMKLPQLNGPWSGEVSSVDLGVTQ